VKSTRLFLVALAALAFAPGAAFAQTQPIPGAKTASGQPAPVTGSAIIVAPAGGGAGLGTVVARDFPLPITCPDGTCSGGGGGSLSAQVTLAAPTYTDGSNPLSLTRKGGLRATLQTSLGADIDFSTPVDLVGADGSTKVTTTNPLPQAPTPTATAALGIAPVSTSAAAACLVLKASAGNFYSASGYVDAASFIMIFDAASAPADGAVTPKAWAYVPALGTWSVIMPGGIPAAMATGATVCRSSSGPYSKTGVSSNTAITGFAK